MALIKCPECGKEVSDNAQFCPNCGYSFVNVVVNNDETRKMDFQKKVNQFFSTALILNLLSIILVVAPVCYNIFSSDDNTFEPTGTVIEEHEYTMIFGVGAIETTPSEEDGENNLLLVGLLMLVALIPLNGILGIIVYVKKKSEKVDRLTWIYTAIAYTAFVLTLVGTLPIILISFGTFGIVLIPSILQIFSSRKYRAALSE